LCVIVDQRDAIFFQPEVERHRIRFAVGNHLGMEDDNDVRERDFSDFVNRFVRDADVAFDRRHALFGPIKRDDRTLAPRIDHRCTQNVRACDDALAPDACHPNIESLRHNSASLSAQALPGIAAGAAALGRNSL
jgi:hypothetical protein